MQEEGKSRLRRAKSIVHLSKALLPLSVLVAFLLLQVEGCEGDVWCLYGDWSRFLSHPWTIVSYALVHYSLGHFLPVFLFLLLLIAFTWHGLSASALWGVFGLGVVGGGLVFLLVSSFSPLASESSLSGGSAGVAALLGYLLVSRLSDHVIWGLTLLGVVMLIDYFTISATNTVGYYSHLMGYALGLSIALYMMWRSNKSRNLVDRKAQIVDKLNSSGFSSLSEEEKDELL